MNLNGIGSYNDATTVSHLAANTTGTSKEAATGNTSVSENDGVIYEPSSATDNNKTYTYNKDVVDKLKADAEARTSQLKSLVESMFVKQGKTYDDSTFWNMIRQGDYTVDPEVAAKAKEDISEDGYWGVKQTSERIVSFAKAITGGDSSKAEAMRDAIKQGYEEAAKMWGGELPDISKQTYDATMKALDDWANETKSE